MKKVYFILVIVFTTNVYAGTGHDHGATPVTTDANAPHRKPNGSLFLPKPSQHFIKLRTQVSKWETLPRTVRLNGQVIANTDAIGKLQALQSGRLNVVNDQFPQVGEALEKGQKLATIIIASDPQEGTNQSVVIADLREQLRLAKLEYQRLYKLGDFIPAREIDAAKATVDSLKARLTAFKRGKTSHETLRSPLSGIVTAVHVTDGQAIQAGDTILEVMAPSNFLVEALSFDPSLPSNITDATLVTGNKVIPLAYQGTTHRLRQQLLPLRFLMRQLPENLADGLPVEVLIQTKDKLQGVAVPANALARNVSNQDIVWIKVAAEHYEPRVIQYQPLDGERVMITAGLKGNERVVTQATTLINQIR